MLIKPDAAITPGKAGRSAGFALFTALVFLLVMSMLGVAMYSSVVRQQHMGGNMQQKVMALTAAGIASHEARYLLRTSTLDVETTCDPSTQDPRICQSNLDHETKDATWAAGGYGSVIDSDDFGGAVDADGGTEGAYAAYPQYYIQLIDDVSGTNIATGSGYGGGASRHLYQITAWGVGGTRSAVAITRMLYVPE